MKGKFIRYKNVFLLFLMVGCGLVPAAAQSYLRGENNIWLNGAVNDDGEGVDFNSGAPSPVTSSWQSMSWAHGSASVCDAQGNLLFYSDGNIVWDKNNDVMLHGWDINNNGNMAPGTSFIDPFSGGSSYNFDGVVIVPMPGSSHKYYIFSTAMLLVQASNPTFYNDTWTGTLYATIVDMELAGGLGGVDPGYRGVPVAEGMAGNLHGVVGENCDYWLVGFGADGNYKAFHITEEGFSPEPVLSTLAPPLNATVGELNISPDRRRIAMACTEEVQVADFDAATGMVNNGTLIGTQTTRYLAFSPNSQYIYFSGLIGLRQYDLADLSVPMALLTVTNYTAYEYDGPLRLAPDNRIYFSHTTPNPDIFNNLSSYAGCILQPDVYGLGCQMSLIQGQSIPLLEDGGWSKYAFPNEVPVLTYDTQSLVKEVPLCFGQPAQLAPEDVAGTDYHWMANTVGSTYVRKGDDTTSTWMAVSPGTYAVQYFSSNPCVFHQDTFIVKAVNFSLYLGPDQVSCDGTAIELAVDIPGGQVLWPDGSTGSRFVAETTGAYWVQGSKDGCTATDSIRVTIMNQQQDLGGDTVLCIEDVGSFVTLQAEVPEGATALWSTGSTEPTIQAADSGLYWVEVILGTCISGDSIYVSRQYCDCPMLFPNAFSPNNDGINDQFKPALSSACPVSDYKLRVYNRWGQMLFVSYRADDGWDGTINGQPADIGTYYYVLSMKTGVRATDISKKGDFVLIR